MTFGSTTNICNIFYIRVSEKKAFKSEEVKASCIARIREAIFDKGFDFSIDPITCSPGVFTVSVA